MKIKFQFKKIIGMSSEYILEHKILNAIIVVGIIISFLSGILNYLTQTPVITVYGSFFIAIAYVAILLYSILSKNFLRSYYLIFGFIITVFAPVFWVINAGSLGTTLYFLILTLVLINITSKNNANIFFSIAMITVIAILLIIEKNYPQKIIGYRTNEDRLIDIFVSILLVAAAIIGSLKIFMNIYRDALKTKIEQKTMLNQEEEKFRKIVSAMPQFISIWDLNMRCTYVSPSVQHLTGYTPEERIANNSEVYIVPESMARLRNVLMDAMVQEQGPNRDPNFTVTCELEQIRKDGSHGTFESTYTFLRDETGAPISILAITADITDHKRAEDALRRSEGQYRLLAENSDDMIWTTDTEMRFTYMSPSVIKVIGRTPEESMQKNAVEIMTPESMNAVIAEYNRLLPEIERGGNPTALLELEQYRKDGSTIWVEASMKTMRDDQGNLTGFLGVSRDISERKRIETAREEAAAALRRSEEQYRLIAENSDDVIFTLDPELRFTYMSPSSFKLRGVTAEEAMLEKLEDIMTPESLNRIIAEYGRVLAEIEKGNKPTVRIEIEQYRKDRSTLWVDISIKTILDGEGHLTGFLGVSRDISEHKLAEEAIQASEEKFRQIVENASDAIYRLSSTGAFTFINPAAELLLGYSINDIQNHYFWEIIPDSHKKDVISFYADMSQRQVRQSYYEFPIILKSGAIMWVGQSVRREENAEGCVEFLGIARDITERKQAEDALQASEEKFRQIVSNVPYAVSIMDMNLRFTYMSIGVQNILGYTPEEIMALPLDRILTPESLAFAGKTFQEAIEHNADGGKHRQVLILPLEYYHKNGSIITGENTVTFLRNADGTPVGILSVTGDITERKQAEAKLKEAKDAAEAANRSKSIFLANMSHEIRTPMNAILGFAQLMQRDPTLTPQLRDHLDIINRSGEHLLATINDILEMSKIEAGRSVFTSTTFDLHALLYDLERMFRLRTDTKNLRFLVEKVGHIPQWVKTDEGKLRQVLINLLGNAVKFTDDGGIVLRICGKGENADTVDIQFEIEDTGPGMGDDEINHLFQAFEQTRSGIKSGGTGLGLALSQGFVKIMGGTISVISTLGKGSIFRFNIPVQEGSEENAAKKELKRRVQCLKPGQDEIRILVVDDRETNRQLMLQLLAAVGFTANYAVNGKEAISMVSKWKPHLVLMDMAMPVMDGYEATRKIKASAHIKNIAIVAVTASAFEEDKKRILDAGADGYLSKPFKDAELFETIRRLTGAEYLYEETSTLKVPETAYDTALMCKTIAGLPPYIVNQMQAAVESADLDMLNDLALQLAAEQPLLAKQIQEMAARYQYEALTELFSSGA